MSFHVYVAFDADRRPLYVGCTSNLSHRMAQHEYRSVWPPLVALVSVLSFEDKREALNAEGDRIRKLRPRFNVAGTHGWRRSVEEAETIWEYESPPDDIRSRKRAALAQLRAASAVA